MVREANAATYRRRMENAIRGGNAADAGVPGMTARTLRLAAPAVLAAAAAATFGPGAPASSSGLHVRVPALRAPSGGHPPRDRAHPVGGRTDGLDPALLGALRAAAGAAARDGVPVVVTSGRRTRAHQAELFADAVARYGSVGEAARWVAPPDRSAHVTGDAVDLAAAGAAWLAGHGAAFGLCRIYANESWHFELRRGATRRGCPAMFPDAAHDPRLRP